MNQIKILHIIDYLKKTGGAEKRLVNDLKRLNKNHFASYVFCMQEYNSDLVLELENSGIKVFISSQKNIFKLFLELFEVVRNVNPNIIHTQLFYSDIFGRFAAKICGVKIILSTIQSSVHEPNIKFYYSTFRRILDFLTIRLCSLVIAVSEFVKQSISNRLFLSLKKISVIYNYVDYDNLTQKNHKNKSHKITKKEEIILSCIGKLLPPKGQMELIKAIHLLLQEGHNLKLIIAGDGPYRKAYENEALKLGIDKKINFLGNVENVNSILMRSNAFVFPSHSEGLPLALLEAVLAKVPCIISSISPNLEIISQENCFMFKSKDIYSLCQAIKKFIDIKINDPKKIINMTDDAYLYAHNKFDPNECAKKLEELYLSLERELR